MKLKEFVGSMRDEVNGFALGDPWRGSNVSVSCVIPLLRMLLHMGQSAEPAYRVLASATDVSIADTGHISKIKVTNSGDRPVFVRMGEIFGGDTQERAATISRVIPVGQETVVEVVCVNASKPIRGGAAFKGTGAYAPGRDSLFCESSARAGLGTGRQDTSRLAQSASWRHDAEYGREIRNAVGDYNLDCMAAGLECRRELCFTAADDDLSSAREAADQVFGELIKKVPLFDHQIGMAIIDTDGFYSLDCFDLPFSWKEVKEAIAGKESLKIAEKDDAQVFEYKPERAKAAVKKALESGFEESVVHEDTFGEDQRVTVVALSGNALVGEVVLLDERVVHLLIARR